VKATWCARLAAVGAGWAVLVSASPARAADAPGSKSPRPATAAAKPASRAPKAARLTDTGSRRSIAGGPTADDASLGVESPELRALREAERELFPPAAPAPGAAWPADLPLLLPHDGEPDVHGSGVPPGPPPPPASAAGASDTAWLARLELPDLPIRWDERVVRYLEFFRDDPRGRTAFTNLFRRWGRARDVIRRALRKKSLPDDLAWVAMIESGFDPTARSSSGAVGVWQFMPETARIYGLVVDRWLDQRYSTQLATAAAVDLLGDLHRRFGTWELALAAYNMGYGGLYSVIRRYNTNDFWSLSRIEGSLPWETTLYVPKILAASVVAHNLAAFGYADLPLDAPVDTEEVDVPPGTSLAAVAQAAGCDPKDVEALNPELRAGRTPPAADGGGPYAVRVPAGKAAALVRALGKLHRDQPALDRYVVRFGETLEQVAAAHRTTVQKLVELNSIAPGEAVRGGAVLLVPAVEEAAAVAKEPAAAPAAPKQSVVVPAEVFVYPDRRRVFYRVLVGDTLKEIAAATHVSVDDLRRWNDLDAGARLEEGMTLQVFVARDADLSRIVVVPESEARVVPVGSEDFFASSDLTKGIKRVTIAAKTGDTLEAIGKRFGVSSRTMERINRRGRGEALKPGEPVVVYVPGRLVAAAAGEGASASGAGSSTATASNAATPGAPVPNAPAANGPLPEPPVPDLLP